MQFRFRAAETLLDFNQCPVLVLLITLRVQCVAEQSVVVFIIITTIVVGWDSSVGIASRYGLDGDQIPVGARFSALVQTGALGPTQPPTKCIPGLFPWGKEAWDWP
jgi:hypothetical protein